MKIFILVMTLCFSSALFAKMKDGEIEGDIEIIRIVSLVDGTSDFSG